MDTELVLDVAPELEQVERRRLVIHVDEQVDIALGAVLAACHAPEDPDVGGASSGRCRNDGSSVLEQELSQAGLRLELRHHWWDRSLQILRQLASIGQSITTFVGIARASDSEPREYRC